MHLCATTSEKNGYQWNEGEGSKQANFTSQNNEKEFGSISDHQVSIGLLHATKNWIDSIIHIQGVHGQEDIIYIHNTDLDMINENKDCLNNQLYSIPFMWRAMLRIAQYRAEALRHHWRVYMCEWIVNLKEKNGRKQSRNWHFSNRPFISESCLF